MIQREEQEKNKLAKSFLTQVFTDLFDTKGTPILVAEKYMTKGYIQLVNNKILNFDEFVNHIEKLSKDLHSINFSFEQVIASTDVISDIHIVDAIKKDGSKIKTKVIAFYFMKGNKIAKVDESTILLQGSEKDKNLSYRTK